MNDEQNNVEHSNIPMTTFTIGSEAEESHQPSLTGEHEEENLANDDRGENLTENVNAVAIEGSIPENVALAEAVSPEPAIEESQASDTNISEPSFAELSIQPDQPSEGIPIVEVSNKEDSEKLTAKPVFHTDIDLTESEAGNTPENKPLTGKETENEEQSKKEKSQNHWQEKFEDVFQELVKIKEQNLPIEVEVKSRIRGGLRVIYGEMPLFLPASHFSLKRTPTEQELQNAIGSKVNVLIHELQEYDEGRKAVIVSRKHILMDEFWENIKTGDIVEGKVSSIASFGVFVDLGGIEGLIHISRLSQVHIDDPSSIVKKGEVVKAIVVELDKAKNRIALSRKELEDSPWKNIDEEFPIGSQHTGIVRRLTEFGAYIELKPGIDGLLRTPEISWTKRIKRPADVLSQGQEIQVEVLSISSEKQTVSLSYKKTQPNPWKSMVDRFPVGTQYTGVISQVMPQGAIVSISEDVDGFMPRSKMRNILKGNKIPFHPGENIEVVIADLIPDDESLILSPANEEQQTFVQEQPKPRKDFQSQSNDGNKQKNSPQGSITLVDLISDSERKNLFKSMND